MKKHALVLSFLVVGGLGVAGAAHAQAPSRGQVSPALAAAGRPAGVAFVATRVTGVIRTGGTIPGEPALAGYNCDDLDVIVSSKETNPVPPGSFSTPKWVRTRHAVGAWSSGQCTFSVPVLPNADFNVYVSANVKDYECHYVSNLVVAPGYSPWTKVPFGKSVAVPDFTLSAPGGKFYCGFIH